MKRIIAMLLLTAMLATTMFGCGFDPDDKGSIIPLYIGSEQSNYDPTAVLYDKDTVKYLGLVFQGLTVMTSEGKIEKGLAKEWYTKTDERRGEYFMYFELNESKWSDGRQLLADHFVYAWKRLLSPETKSEAAALLFDIKNAKAVKAGEMSIDNLGIAAVDNLLIEVQFEKEIDYNLFLEAVSSPALAPMRDDVVIGHEDTWATTLEEATFNGQFTLKTMEKGKATGFEKANGYRASSKDDEEVSPLKYVKPYKLLEDRTKDLAGQLSMFNNGEIYYLGQLTKSDYESNKANLVTQPLLSTLTIYFNNTKKALSSADGRKGLSMALDRNQIASIIGCGTKAATGFVSDGFYDASFGSSFRSVGGDVISASADAAKAKDLIKSGGATGSLTLTYLENDLNSEIADYCISAWSTAGASVKAQPLAKKKYEEALKSGSFDMIMLDVQGLSTNAVSVLAPYATRYSGSVVSVADDSKGYAPHVTGFENADYDAAIDAVYAASTMSERASLLHTAEKLLAESMPAAPLAFYYDYYLVSSELKNVKSSAYGYRLLEDAELKDYAEKNAAYEAKQADDGSAAA